MNGIGWAIKQLHLGACVVREGWDGKGQRLELQVPDANSKMSLPYIFIHTVQGDRVPWLASQTDILALDWTLSPEEAPRETASAAHASNTGSGETDYVRQNALGMAIEACKGLDKEGGSSAALVVKTAEEFYTFLRR